MRLSGAGNGPGTRKKEGNDGERRRESARGRTTWPSLAEISGPGEVGDSQAEGPKIARRTIEIGRERRRERPRPLEGMRKGEELRAGRKSTLPGRRRIEGAHGVCTSFA